ncbi:helix-turn-helix domain-containing protein [Streptomyces tubercidicus]|uniref:helix-turn-helix domain-containing protein n=1 Tax=Streptomyces tubercidicus TaxID=47759 RepID=UPI003676F664
MTDPNTPLLTVDEAAVRLATGVRFVRRLIAERRIAFVHIGRHVRIPASAVEAFIQEGMVAPITAASVHGRAA